MQHFVDLQENSELGESNSWLSVKEQSGAAPNTNLDRVLFNDLVEIVPLVQSLIVNPSNPFHCNEKKEIFFFKILFICKRKRKQNNNLGNGNNVFWTLLCWLCVLTTY